MKLHSGFPGKTAETAGERDMFIARFPRSMSDGHIDLHPPRMADCRSIRDGLAEAGILPAERKGPFSNVTFWWWIRKTYLLPYCVRLSGETVGFIGLNGLALGRSAEVSLAIFSPQMRRHGYGTKAFRLLAENLRRYRLIPRIIVRVDGDNPASISFWKRLGFEDRDCPDGRRVMHLGLVGEE